MAANSSKFSAVIRFTPEGSGRAVYYDGMKTREDFVSRARKALERPGEDVLLFVEDGEVEGLINSSKFSAVIRFTPEGSGRG